VFFHYENLFCTYFVASDASCFTNSSTYVVEDEMVSLFCNANGYSYLPAAMSMNVEWSGAGCPSVITTGNGTFVSSSVSILAQPPTVPSCYSTTLFTAPNQNPLFCATNAPTYLYTWSSPLINVSCKYISDHNFMIVVTSSPINSRKLPNAPD
jgi:hypothetical protein